MMPLRFIFPLLILQLTACSVAREELRGTYDYRVVSPGHTRQEIENQIGEPIEAGVANDELIRAVYQTSLVDRSEKRQIIDARKGADALTFGLIELISPFGLFNEEDTTKLIVVFYGQNGMATEVDVACRNIDYSSFRSIGPAPADAAICTSPFVL